MAAVRRFAKKCVSSLMKKQLRVSIDCSLENTMTEKELGRLVQQFKQCNALNAGFTMPASLYLTGLRSSGRLRHTLDTLWPTHINHDFHRTEILHYEYFRPADLIYLSPDSQNVLRTVDEDKVYVLGGVVDLAINKRLTEYKATMAGLHTAKLPVLEYMESRGMPGSLCFPINQVLGILLEVYNSSGWECALERYVPKRKGFVIKSKP